MSGWMHGAHAVRHLRAEPPMEPEPVEVTDPVDVVAWLRALPLGTILLDRNISAWQLADSPFSAGLFFVAAGDHARYHLTVEADMRFVAAYAPFQVLYVPPGGAT